MSENKLMLGYDGENYVDFERLNNDFTISEYLNNVFTFMNAEFTKRFVNGREHLWIEIWVCNTKGEYYTYTSPKIINSVENRLFIDRYVTMLTGVQNFSVGEWVESIPIGKWLASADRNHKEFNGEVAKVIVRWRYNLGKSSDESVFDDVLDETLGEFTESTISRLENELVEKQECLENTIALWISVCEENSKLKKKIGLYELYYGYDDYFHDVYLSRVDSGCMKGDLD